MSEQIKNHKHYELACRAYTNTSFSPETRAESEINYFEATVKELKEIGCSSEGIDKFERLFLDLLRAKARCISAMITGPAKFPVARAEKANKAEHNKSVELTDYIQRVKKAIDKQNNPQNHSISSDDKNALQLLKDKLEKLTAAQSQMKQCNKIIKSVKTNREQKIEQLKGVFGPMFDAEKLFIPDCFGNIGFASFSLTNNNATIKATEDRIKQLEMASNRKTREITTIEGIKMVENAEENRVQFFFNGKPEQSIIDLMKSNGFKWSPTQGCWQRLWNNNAIYAINHYILPVLKNKLAA